MKSLTGNGDHGNDLIRQSHNVWLKRRRNHMMKDKMEKLATLLKDEKLAKELLSLKKAEDAREWMEAHISNFRAF